MEQLIQKRVAAIEHDRAAADKVIAVVAFLGLRRLGGSR
jgi:hypothetical protein